MSDDAETAADGNLPPRGRRQDPRNAGLPADQDAADARRADGTELISVAAHLAFPIRDGVPMLSLDEAAATIEPRTDLGRTPARPASGEAREQAA